MKTNKTKAYLVFGIFLVSILSFFVACGASQDAIIDECHDSFSAGNVMCSGDLPPDENEIIQYGYYKFTDVLWNFGDDCLGGGSGFITVDEDLNLTINFNETCEQSVKINESEWIALLDEVSQEDFVNAIKSECDIDDFIYYAFQLHELIFANGEQYKQMFYCERPVNEGAVIQLVDDLVKKYFSAEFYKQWNSIW